LLLLLRHQTASPLSPNKSGLGVALAVKCGQLNDPAFMLGPLDLAQAGFRSTARIRDRFQRFARCLNLHGSVP
jgi:hypothetical protein